MVQPASVLMRHSKARGVLRMMLGTIWNGFLDCSGSGPFKS
jgi:hypothetical protein